MRLDELTNQFLANDLKQLEGQLDSVENSIASLQAQKIALGLKIKAIRNIDGFTAPVAPVHRDTQAELSLEGPKVPVAGVSASGGVGNLVVSNAVVGGAGVVRDGSERPGFRDAIRTVLKNANRGLRGREVALELKRIGFEPGGKSDPALRVATELYRMSRAGLIKKRGTLHYALEPAQGG